MSRVRAFLDRIEDPKLPPLEPGDPRDRALLSLLVHLAAIDGTVESDEFALLQLLRPDLSAGELLSWVADTSGEPLDLDEVVNSTSSIDERWDVLRFAARMVAMDGDVQQLEASRLGELARKLGLPVTAARHVLDEVVATGGPVDESRVRSAVEGARWARLTVGSEPPGWDLRATGELLATLKGGDDVVAAIYTDGLAVRLTAAGPPAFVRWVDLRSYTRVPVPGSAFHLRTWDGRTLATTDERLREVAALADRVYARGPR
jgi:uncharacterized tellurite resistance protein B-like protein